MTGQLSIFALSIILFAAVLHALWNALIKSAGDRYLTLAMINFGHGITGIIMVAIFMPPSAQSWPFIIASTVIHWFYYGFLLLSYRLGDLSQVYPIARGIAPVLVAIGAYGFAGEILPLASWAGILAVSFGICLLFLGERRRMAGGAAITSALLTGMTIAAYSVVDGMGVRLSESPFGYIGWLFLLECVSGFALLRLRQNPLETVSGKAVIIGLAGGLISALAYGLAIYAKTLTALGVVSAIRESSVIIAALIGVVWFGERPWGIRLAAASIVAAGVILMAAG